MAEVARKAEGAWDSGSQGEGSKGVRGNRPVATGVIGVCGP